MSEFKINDFILRTEAEDIARQAMREVQEYGGDVHEFMHQTCDGHEWIIYTYKALLLCAECDTSEGEQYLEDMGMGGFDDLTTRATRVAFATLLGACHEAYARLN